MRAIRKGEEETGQSPPRWAEVRPNLFIAARNSAGAKQTNRQHRRPLPAQTQQKNPRPAFSYSSLKLQPQPKIAASQKSRPAQSKIQRSNCRGTERLRKCSRDRYPEACVLQEHRPNRDWIVTAKLPVVQEESTAKRTKSLCVSLLDNILCACDIAPHAKDATGRSVAFPNHIAPGDIDAITLSAPAERVIK